ncbi:MAG: hypothetical protein ACOCQY_02925 [Halorhabdus sp.]
MSDTLPETTEEHSDADSPQQTSDDRVELYHDQRHRNGDQTAVLLLSFGSGFQAIALDVDAGGQLLEVKEIGDSPDREKAVGMLEYWLQQNPEGILGGTPGGDGLLAKLGIGGGSP